MHFDFRFDTGLTTLVECLPQDRATRMDATFAAVHSAQPYLDVANDQLRGRDKVRRALERLRRTVIKVLEPTAQENAATTTLPEDARCGARRVLRLIGQVLVDAVHKVSGCVCKSPHSFKADPVPEHGS